MSEVSDATKVRDLTIGLQNAKEEIIRLRAQVVAICAELEAAREVVKAARANFAVGNDPGFFKGGFESAKQLWQSIANYDAGLIEMTCKHCQHKFKCYHGDEHKGLCCNCYDLSWGQPLEDINEERRVKGLPPILKPWPEDDAVVKR